MASLVKLIATFLIAYAGLVGAVWLLQRNLMYIPDTAAPDLRRVDVPGMRAVTLETADGLTLQSWYRPAEPGRPTLLYFHGNAGNIEGRAFKVKLYLERGFGVLLVEYRGYGGNPGSPSEAGLYADGRAALAWLREAGVEREDLALYGESLGTGVAVQMAAEAGPGRGYRALVLEAPFTAMGQVAQEHYPYLPARWLVRDRYDSLAKIGRVDTPLLVVHGEADRVVPFRFGRRLFAAAPEPKDHLWVEESGHNNLYDFGVAGRIADFVADPPE